MIIYLELITRELLGPPDLSRAQVLYIHKLTEVVMVCKDKDLVFAAFQVVAPSFKDFNNGQELLIESLVSGLGGNHLSRENSN